MSSSNNPEDKIYRIGSVIVVLVIVLALFSSTIAENWFQYDVVEQKQVQEEYEHPVVTISTYVCYTTTYGECYHAKGCGSLWNSSYKTTVYEAKEDGYRSCSKCTPRERTTLTLTETRTRTVTKTETVTKTPSFWVWLVGSGILGAVYIVLTIEPRRELKANKTANNVN